MGTRRAYSLKQALPVVCKSKEVMKQILSVDVGQSIVNTSFLGGYFIESSYGNLNRVQRLNISSDQRL